MKIFLGADHGGYYLKEKIEVYLAKRGMAVEDAGNLAHDPADDFPQFAHAAVIKLLGEDEATDPRAILVCTGGQGMAMAANRFKGIRAAVIWDKLEARESRNDNDANVLCLPSRVLESDEALWQGIVDEWLETPFAGAERYMRRNKELDNLN